MTENTIKIPEELNEEGVKIVQAIIGEAEKYDKVYESAGTKFYSPKEWKERGEIYGTKSRLIVVHEGDCLSPFFNLDCGCYPQYESMVKALDKIGYYAEACTCWYSAIYKK